MSDELVDIETYVSGVDADDIVIALSTELNPLVVDEIDRNRTLCVCGDVTVEINSRIKDGFISVWIRGAAPWKSNVDLARFLSRRLGCCARCDPGSEYPHANPNSDAFLEISSGRETIIEWG